MYRKNLAILSNAALGIAAAISGGWNVYRENSGKFARHIPRSAKPLRASRITKRLGPSMGDISFI